MTAGQWQVKYRIGGQAEIVDACAGLGEGVYRLIDVTKFSGLDYVKLVSPTGEIIAAINFDRAKH